MPGTGTEILMAAVIKRREAKPRISMAPGASALHKYVAEILDMRAAGCTLAEITHALYVTHQIKIGVTGLSAFIIRHQKRIAASNQTKDSASDIRAPIESKSKVPVPKSPSQVAPGDGKKTVIESMGAEKIEAGTGAPEFVLSDTRVQNAKDEKKLRRRIEVRISEMSKVARMDFERNHGASPEECLEDPESWTRVGW